jgi:hypothetical protein
LWGVGVFYERPAPVFIGPLRNWNTVMRNYTLFARNSLLALGVAAAGLAGCEADIHTDAPPPGGAEVDIRPNRDIDVDVDRQPGGGVDVDVDMDRK